MIRRVTFAASPALAASFFLTTALVLASAPLRAATYTLEPDYTQGVFRWNHLGFSSPAAQFAQGTGTLEFDPADPSKSSVQVTIPLASLNTGVPALDEDFRSTDFFDTAKFPTATFKSTKVVKRAAADHLDITGDLNLHGVTKPVMLSHRGQDRYQSAHQCTHHRLRRDHDAQTLGLRPGQVRASSGRRDPNAHHRPGGRCRGERGIPEGKGGEASRCRQGRGQSCGQGCDEEIVSSELRAELLSRAQSFGDG